MARNKRSKCYMKYGPVVCKNKERRKAKHMKRHPNDMQAVSGQTAEPYSAKNNHRAMMSRHAEHRKNVLI